MSEPRKIRCDRFLIFICSVETSSIPPTCLFTVTLSLQPHGKRLALRAGSPSSSPRVGKDYFFFPLSTRVMVVVLSVTTLAAMCYIVGNFGEH